MLPASTPGPPFGLVENLGLEKIREQAGQMERDAQRFYELAAQRTQDADTRKLLGDLAAAEAGHEQKASELTASIDGEPDRIRRQRGTQPVCSDVGSARLGRAHGRLRFDP